MRKIYGFVAIALICAIGAGTISCDDKEKETPNGKIELSTSLVEFSLDAGSKSVNVLSGKNWTATSNQEWISIEPSENSFDVVVSAATEERQGTVTVKNGEDSKTVTVKQMALVSISDEIDVNTTALIFSAEGETKTVEVTSDLPWTTSQEDWIKIVKAESSFTVTLDANPGTTVRKGSIIVDNTVERKTISVEQAAATVVDDEKEFKGAYSAYYGDWYEVGASNFVMSLTTTDVDEDGYVIGDGYMVAFDFFSETPADEANPDIAPGRYTIEDTYLPFSSLVGYYDANDDKIYGSAVDVVVDAMSANRIEVVGGYFDVEVTGGVYSITCDLELMDGTTLKGRYDGEIYVSDERESEEPAVSTIEDDLDVGKITTGGGYIEYYGGAEDQEGVYDYFAEVYTEGLTLEDAGYVGSGDSFTLQFYSAEVNTSALPVGTYTIGSSGAVGTVMAGQVLYGVYPVYSWYYHLTDGEYVEMAPLTSGEVVVSEADGVYNIVIDAYDDADNHITCEYEGAIPFSDNSKAAGASAAKARNAYSKSHAPKAGIKPSAIPERKHKALR